MRVDRCLYKFLFSMTLAGQNVYLNSGHKFPAGVLNVICWEFPQNSCLSVCRHDNIKNSCMSNPSDGKNKANKIVYGQLIMVKQHRNLCNFCVVLQEKQKGYNMTSQDHRMSSVRYRKYTS